MVAKMRGLYISPQGEGGPTLTVSINFPAGYTPAAPMASRPSARQLMYITPTRIDPLLAAEVPGPFAVPDFDLNKEMAGSPKGLPTVRP
jgi:hypothetical protein